MSLKYKEITDKILKGFYEVYNELGDGFLESVYENAFIKATRIEVGLLLNFGRKPEFKRFIFNEERKNNINQYKYVKIGG